MSDPTQTLAERLAQINAEAKEWMKNHPGGWASGLTDDLAHWAEYGITTAAQLDAYLDACAKKEHDEWIIEEYQYGDAVGEMMGRNE